VEGGTVAFELVLALPSDVDRNLLGERSGYDEHCGCYPERPSVLDIAHLDRGVIASRFGAVRLFPIPSFRQALQLEVVDLAVGHGVGDCDSCPRIERLSARVSVRHQ
jgi:hypothetical protein